VNILALQALLYINTGNTNMANCEVVGSDITSAA
jgi:hypothetical protein